MGLSESAQESWRYRHKANEQLFSVRRGEYSDDSCSYPVNVIYSREPSERYTYCSLRIVGIKVNCLKYV